MRRFGLLATVCCLVLGWSCVELPARAISSSSAVAPANEYRARVRKAAAYLWSQQGDDGGWHNTAYGLLRSGQSLTPFVLYMLLNVPESVLPLPRENAERALEFIQRH